MISRTLRLQRITSATLALLFATTISQAQADTWIGAGPDDNWSTGTNWLDGTAPIVDDVVMFNAGDSGGTNIVDMLFPIAGLQYINDGTHTTEIDGTLDINGPLSLSFQSTSTGVGTPNATLRLGNSSVLDIGAPDARADVTIGRNDSNADASDAVGLLDARQGTANVNANNLIIGQSPRGGTSRGTLQWDQAGTLSANSIVLSQGSNAVGTIEVPTDGTLLLDTGSLTLGFNNTNAAGAASATLDLTTTDPMFAAAVRSGLTLGFVSPATTTGTADGTLRLGENSVLDIGAPDARANVTIGRNDSNADASDAVGVLDARQGTANVNANNLIIGRSVRGGTSRGTFSMGDSTVANVNTLNIGQDPNSTGTVNLEGGVLSSNVINLTNGEFNFTGGRLAVNTFNGSLTQEGGILAPGVSTETQNLSGLTAISGDYSITPNGAVEIEIGGLLPGEFDVIDIAGDAILSGTLDVSLLDSPILEEGDTFDVLLAETISGMFENERLPTFDGLTFRVSYLSIADMQDIVRLTLTPVPLPAAVWLFATALLGLLGVNLRRRHAA